MPSSRPTSWSMAPRRKGFPAVRRLRSALRSGIGGVSRAAVRRIACAVLWLLPGFASAEVLVGMTDTAAYFPRLAGRRVAVLANQTSVADMPGRPRAGSLRIGSASGGPAPCPGIRRDGDFLARTRLPRYGRCRRTCRQYGRCPHRDSDPLALRRRLGPPVGRGDAFVRRPADRPAGRGAAFLYLLHHDAPPDGCLCRCGPRGDRTRPSQSQRGQGRGALLPT